MKETKVTLTIPLKAQGKESVRTAKGIAYIPAKSKDYMRTIGKYALTLPASIRRELLESHHYAVGIFCSFRPPASISNRKKNELDGKPYNQKPDVDNIQKALFDGMTHIVFKDDKSIAKCSIVKHYGTQNEIEITITGYKEEE